eukprot:CAMPEP_0184302932 /NCGR_PEP_ID=MMETSP1049-20130417/12767_1 /TAXON_ID=77928 /ORGANISM="Proteomonas sulcata, Strain CCMP704" /LENGTH=90 /DNA_ID=CAMNT_0026614337 /DNA_START=497 /DNA_END=769 /DNA_ORIENTATION=+
MLPQDICFARWCQRDCPNWGHQYKLRAVVLHSAFSSQSGHYTTLYRTDEGWVEMDDARCEVLDPEQVASYLTPSGGDHVTVAHLAFYSID